MIYRNKQNLINFRESQSMINERRSYYDKSLHQKAAKNQYTKLLDKILKCNKQAMRHQRSVRQIKYNRLLYEKGNELMKLYQFQVEDALIANKIQRSKSMII